MMSAVAQSAALMSSGGGWLAGVSQGRMLKQASQKRAVTKEAAADRSLRGTDEEGAAGALGHLSCCSPPPPPPRGPRWRAYDDTRHTEVILHAAGRAASRWVQRGPEV